QKRHILMFKRWLDANDMRIGFRMYQTRKAVACRTADTFALLRILLIEEHTHRQVKWLVAEFLEIVTQLLNAQFMADRWKSVWFAGGWFCRIFSANTMNVIQIFGFAVIRLQVVIRNGPRRRNAAVMAQLSKILFPQAHEGCAVELRIAA